MPKDNLGWDRIVEEGEKLYNYMIHNFNEMFEDESKIKDFDIGISTIGLDCYADHIKEKYNDEIQKELILLDNSELVT